VSKLTSLPPLNPLHVFAVASRLGSFTKAARELNVTQSAVSRQISTLEASMNVMLFRRQREGVMLTEIGEYYHREVGAAFARIEAATREVSNSQFAEPLRLRVYSTFAVNWLIPRLPQFKQKHPDIKLQLSTATQPVDFSRDSAHIAIQFGDDQWPGKMSRKILGDVFQPVCSPAYRDAMGLREPGDLLRAQLLNARLRSRDWKDWFATKEMDPDEVDYLDFPSSLLAYEAAIAGMGIAMGQSVLVQNYIQRNELVALFSPHIREGMGYYVVWPEAIQANSKMRNFLQWLSVEARKSEAGK
jgi:LysR family glycine cleavage system transcriptional activator